jgi:hypothetical protein
MEGIRAGDMWRSAFKWPLREPSGRSELVRKRKQVAITLRENGQRSQHTQGDSNLLSFPHKLASAGGLP